MNLTFVSPVEVFKCGSPLPLVAVKGETATPTVVLTNCQLPVNVFLPKAGNWPYFLYYKWT